MGEIARFDHLNLMIEQLDDTQLDMVQKKIYAMQIQKLDRALTEVTEKVNMLEQAREIDKEMYEKTLELERKRHYVTESRYGFVGLSDLGKEFDVTIGAKTMGSLLRIAGVAKAKQSITEPYAELIRQGYAKSQDTKWGGVVWQWNPEKCKAKIINWLEKNDLLDTFLSIPSEKDLMKFIQELEESNS